MFQKYLRLTFRYGIIKILQIESRVKTPNDLTFHCDIIKQKTDFFCINIPLWYN